MSVQLAWMNELRTPLTEHLLHRFNYLLPIGKTKKTQFLRYTWPKGRVNFLQNTLNAFLREKAVELSFDLTVRKQRRRNASRMLDFELSPSQDSYNYWKSRICTMYQLNFLMSIPHFRRVRIGGTKHRDKKNARLFKRKNTHGEMRDASTVVRNSRTGR